MPNLKKSTHKKKNRNKKGGTRSGRSASRSATATQEPRIDTFIPNSNVEWLKPLTPSHHYALDAETRIFWQNKLAMSKYSGFYKNMDFFKNFVLKLSDYYVFPTFAATILRHHFPRYYSGMMSNYGNVYLDALSSHLIIIVGLLTDILDPTCKIIIKGGKAVQMLTSNMPLGMSNSDEKNTYFSNDIDITVVSYDSKYSAHTIALHMGNFIQWLTAPEGYFPHLSILDAPKISSTGEEDIGSIVKVSYSNPNTERRTFTAMMDIGYVESGEFAKSMKLVKISEFTIGYIGYFYVNRMKDILLEKLHYIIQYTSSDSLLDTTLNKFRESLKRSTRVLLDEWVKTTNGNMSNGLASLLHIYFSMRKIKKPQSEQIALRSDIINFLK
jgi:hypothetical protein